MAMGLAQFSGTRPLLSDGEVTTVSAICNRVSRMLGLMDREGLQRDIAIVQHNCPLDLDALLASGDTVFVDELLTIVDAADRSTGYLSDSYQSRFMLHDNGAVLLG